MDQKIQTKIKQKRDQRTQEYIALIKADADLIALCTGQIKHLVQVFIKKACKLWVNPQHPKYNYVKDNVIQQTALFLKDYFEEQKDVNWCAVVRESFDIDLILGDYTIR